jgi:hypothetical protein
MTVWNQAMREILQRDPLHNTFVEVFQESFAWNMVDNIHMDNPWYNALGGMLAKLITQLVNTTSPATTTGNKDDVE